MKHLKMLGLLVVAAAALMAFAGNAYAANPVLTSPAGTDYTGTIHVTQKAGTSGKLEAGIEDTCTTSTMHGHVTVNANNSASGPITSLTWGTVATPCTAEKTETTNNGELTIAKGGAVTDFNTEVTVKQFGVSCVYGGTAAGTVIGTLTGTNMVVNTNKLPKIAGGVFCAATGTWKAEYTVTTPGTLIVD